MLAAPELLPFLRQLAGKRARPEFHVGSRTCTGCLGQKPFAVVRFHPSAWSPALKPSRWSLTAGSNRETAW